MHTRQTGSAWDPRKRGVVRARIPQHAPGLISEREFRQKLINVPHLSLTPPETLIGDSSRKIPKNLCVFSNHCFTISIRSALGSNYVSPAHFLNDGHNCSIHADHNPASIWEKSFLNDFRSEFAIL
jgi:hypothetical protein